MIFFEFIQTTLHFSKHSLTAIHYFQNLKLMEQHLWSSTKAHLDSLKSIFMLLLKNCRQETLTWIGDCLDKNRARGRLSALNMFSLDVLNSVSDGFMINLTAILLHLSQPFISESTNVKLLKIDPTYSAAKVMSCEHLS